MIDDEEANVVFERLRALKRHLRNERYSLRDVALTMIEAIISEGMNTRARIVGAADRLGFSVQFIANMLDGGCPVHWHKLADGVYVIGPRPRPASKPCPADIF